jgi:enamine deaminase RidA (YjgF/YER057c/UK114 family)
MACTRTPAYSQVVVVKGDVRTVYVGGQNAVDSSGQIVGEGNIGEQAEQILLVPMFHLEAESPRCAGLQAHLRQPDVDGW